MTAYDLDQQCAITAGVVVSLVLIKAKALVETS
jgi:hypothetical protein